MAIRLGKLPITENQFDQRESAVRFCLSNPGDLARSRPIKARFARPTLPVHPKV
jgi:hypothetical protein